MRNTTRWAAVVATVLVVSLALPATARNDDPGGRPWEAGASNMGLCSAYLGQTDGIFEPNARAEVNHLLKEFGFGYKNNGELYSVRAQQKENQHPTLECVRR